MGIENIVVGNDMRCDVYKDRYRCDIELSEQFCGLRNSHVFRPGNCQGQYGIDLKDVDKTPICTVTKIRGSSKMGTNFWLCR